MGVRARIASLVVAALAALVGIAAPARGIAGGSVVGSSGWPWAVFIFDLQNNFECSGVLISPRVVATAAHCIGPSPELIVTADQTVTENTESFVEVTETEVIPSYDENDIDTPDVAKVVLEEPIPDTEPIELIDPDQAEEVVGPEAIALGAGYGNTAGNTSNSGVLREGAFDELDPCSNQNKVCTSSGPPNGCAGDSGGPLIVQLGIDSVTENPNPSNGDWRLAGLFSLGDQDCAFFSAFSSITDSEQHQFLSPPDTVITKGPKRRTEKRRAAFEFEASGDLASNLTFTCSLDGRPFQECESPHKTARLKKGKHTFEVRASAGFLEDLSPAKHAWKIVG